DGGELLGLAALLRDLVVQLFLHVVLERVRLGLGVHRRDGRRTSETCNEGPAINLHSAPPCFVVARDGLPAGFRIGLRYAHTLPVRTIRPSSVPVKGKLGSSYARHDDRRRTRGTRRENRFCSASSAVSALIVVRRA